MYNTFFQLPDQHWHLFQLRRKGVTGSRLRQLRQKSNDNQLHSIVVPEHYEVLQSAGRQKSTLYYIFSKFSISSRLRPKDSPVSRICSQVASSIRMP